MKRSPGRPPLDDDDPSVDVHIRMPSKQYDATYRRASRARLTVPELIRRELRTASKRDAGNSAT